MKKTKNKKRGKKVYGRKPYRVIEKSYKASGSKFQKGYPVDDFTK